MARLDKVVAERTGWGRKLARTRVRQGRVRVEDDVVRDPAAGIDPGVTTLWIGGRALPPPPELALLHKPLGVLSTTSDPHGRASLAEAAAELLELGLHPVGRLDADTDGLLPFSRRGRWTQHLLHPRHGVEKRYLATVQGLPDAGLGQRLAAGVQTADGVHTARLVHVQGSVLELIVTEGKHRMVRRMLANLGHPVTSLRRLSFGPMQLGDLAPGAWRPATADELAWIEDRTTR